MEINCVYCEETHESAKAVRACASAHSYKPRRRSQPKAKPNYSVGKPSPAPGYVAPGSPPPHDREIHKRIGPTQNYRDDT